MSHEAEPASNIQGGARQRVGRLSPALRDSTRLNLTIGHPSFDPDALREKYRAERLDAGNIVCLLADGGWKYLSTRLWTTNYEDLPEDIEDKIWW